MINAYTSQAPELNQPYSTDINTVTQFWAHLNHDDEVVAEQLNFYLYLFLYQYYIGIQSIIDNYNQALERYTKDQAEKEKDQHSKSNTQATTEIPNLLDESLTAASEDSDDSHAIHEEKSTKKRKKMAPKKPNLIVYDFHRWLRIVLDIAPESVCLNLFDESLKPFNESDKRQKEHDKLKANFSLSLQEHSIQIISLQGLNKDKESDDELHRLEEKLKDNLDAETRKSTEEKILKIYESRIRIPKKKVESILNLLNLLIQKGNQDQLWDLCLVNSVILAEREKHPLSHDHQWQKLLDIEKLEVAVQAKLKAHWDDALFIEQVIKLSLMIDSYIIESKLYRGVIHAINQQAVNTFNDLLYVDVCIDQNNPPRKVFISPVTRIYLQRYRQIIGATDSSLSLNFQSVNEELYRLLGLSKYRYPRSVNISSWFNVIKSYLLFVKGVPGLLIYYLTNYGSSYSLKENKFEQLFSPSSWNSQMVDVPEQADIDSNEEGYVTATRIANPPAWSHVLAILNVTHIHDNRKKPVLDDIVGKLSQVRNDGFLNKNEKLFIDWAIYLLSKSSPMMPYSVRKRLFAIGQRLVALANGIEISSDLVIQDTDSQEKIKYLSPSDRLELYRDCLELAVSHHNHETMRGYLHAFERWLCEQKQQQPILYDEEFHREVNSSSNYSVNASLILFEDYHAIYDKLVQLREKTGNEDYLYMQLILTLGFRLGMRRDEIVGLKINDYLYSAHNPILIIQTSEARTLKTSNAVRFFHLVDHMPQAEWQLINDHYQQVTSKNQSIKHGHIKYLFPQIERIEVKMHNDRYFSPLMIMIRDRVQDNNIKFHQLRHSKASFEFLAAFNAQFVLGLDGLFFANYPKTAQWIQESKLRLGHALTSQTHFNKAPFWIHEIMGHGSMMMTLGHYVHTLDMVVAAFAYRQSEDQMSLEWLSSLELMDKNRYYRYPDKRLSIVLSGEQQYKQSAMPIGSPDDNQKSSATQSNVDNNQNAIKAKLLSNNNPMIDGQLLTYFPYAKYQLLIHEQNANQLAILKAKLGMTDTQVYDYLHFTKQHPKLLFQAVAKNQKTLLLNTLQQIERYYGVSLQKTDAPPAIPSKLQDDLILFEKRLKVRTKSENGTPWVNQFELRCFTKEDVIVLVNCMEGLGFEPSIVIFYPTSNTQKLNHVERYWQQALIRHKIEFRHEALNNKHGRVHVSATMKGKKVQAFYFALAIVAIYLLNKQQLIDDVNFATIGNL
jgi:integrase